MVAHRCMHICIFGWSSLQSQTCVQASLTARILFHWHVLLHEPLQVHVEKKLHGYVGVWRRCHALFDLKEPVTKYLQLTKVCLAVEESTAGSSTAGSSTAGSSTAGSSTAGSSTAGSSTAGSSTAVHKEFLHVYI